MATFRIAIEQNRLFTNSCRVLGRTRTQIFLAAVAATIREARAVLASEAANTPPDFELLTFQQAREFLAPYYGGLENAPSVATLIRRIEEGKLIAVQDVKTRTSPKRITKASLVKWLREIGKELEAQARLTSDAPCKRSSS
jgi:hypothetical protein